MYLLRQHTKSSCWKGLEQQFLLLFQQKRQVLCSQYMFDCSMHCHRPLKNFKKSLLIFIIRFKFKFSNGLHINYYFGNINMMPLSHPVEYKVELCVLLILLLTYYTQIWEKVHSFKSNKISMFLNPHFLKFSPIMSH